MKKLITIFTLVLIAVAANAESIHVSNPDYKSASKSKQFISLKQVSWKLRFLKSTFKSYVKDFNVNYDIKSNLVENGVIKFDVKSIDTDIDSRNEKMWDFCLDYKNHPQMTVSFTKPIDLSSPNEQTIPAKINVRGKDFLTNIRIRVTDNAGKKEIAGTADLSLKALEIPDPSIAVGKLEDGFTIDFNVIQP